MQASPRELNPVHGTLAAILSGAGAAVAVLAPRWGGAPTAAELLRGTSSAARTSAEAMALVVAFGLYALATLLPMVRRCGWFAACAGSALAVGGAGAAVLAGLPPVAAGCTAAVLAVLATTWLRERGLLSLVLVPLAAPLPALLSVRIQLELADASRLIESVQSRAPLFGSVLVELPAGAGEAEALAIALALQPPHREEPVATLAVEEEGVHARWARQLGLPTLRIRGTSAELLDADRRAALGHPGTARVVATWITGPDGSHRLQVQAPELGGATVALFHWGGTRAATLDARGSAQLDAAAVLPQVGSQVPLPAGGRIQGLAVSPVSADVYGWFDVPLP